MIRATAEVYWSKAMTTTNMIGKIVFFLVMTVFTVGILAPAAHAALQAVGPTDAVNGFPVWYQDTNNLTLEYCLPRNQAQLDAGACLILPAVPGPGFNLPFVFPTNYPDEAFYWNATANAVMQSSGGFNSVLVLGLEGAFSTGNVVPGAQITFSRLRIVVDAPVAGDYTVTTPFGNYFFPGVTVGKRAITFVTDIGIGAPGDFTGALKGTTGPFLRASATEGGAPLPLVTLPTDTSGDLFLSDTAAPVFVTGSPAGTNHFKICTSTGVFPATGTPCVTQPLFTLMGRAFNGTPFVADKSYYVRNTSGSGVIGVFGSTFSSSATATYVAGGTGIPSAIMSRDAVTRDLFAAILFNAGTTLPSSVTITATDVAKAPTAVTTSLSDLVDITLAAYDAGTNSLIIHAASSDQFAPTPALHSTGLGTLVNGVLVVTPEIAPPAFVTVTSSKGGSSTAPVTFFSPSVVNFIAGPNGSISGTASQTIAYLASTTAVTAVPNTGYHFLFWSGTNGFVPSLANPLIVPGVTTSMDITASFAINAYAVSFFSGGNGSVVGDVNQYVNYLASTTTVTAAPAAGYHFVNWTGSGGFTSASNPLTVTGVTTPMNITANFAPGPYAVNFFAGAGGSISGTASQSVPFGSASTPVTAVSATGYHFVNWTGTGSFVTTTANPLTVANVTADVNITANFASNPTVSAYDFNGDQNIDILLQNINTGQAAAWYMNGTTYSTDAILSQVVNVADGWKIVGANELGNLILQNSNSGQVAIWNMLGIVFQSDTIVSQPVNVAGGWDIVATGDFNGDAKTDLVLQNSISGRVAIWIMNESTYISDAVLSQTVSIGTGWNIVGTGDFNGDGQVDLLLQNPNTNRLAVWFMSGTAYVSDAVLAKTFNAAAGWSVVGTGDFNKDNNVDIVLQNSATGDVAVWLMNGTTFVSDSVLSQRSAVVSGWHVVGPR